MNNQLQINTDGGSRGNPGPAACGVVIRRNGEIVEKVSKYLGVVTNNQAEYEGVILAMEFLLENKDKYEDIKELKFVLDSELVVRQLQGIYKIKHPNIQVLANRVRTLVKESGKIVNFNHVLRENNKDADLLVNQELDSLV